MLIREYEKRIFCFLLILIFMLSFFIVSFAEPFTGAYLYTGTDPVTGYPIVEVRGINPTGQTFSSGSVIENNAYNNAPILTDNTFNGSTEIKTAFTDITSNGNNYTGSVDLTVSGLQDSMQSNSDTFRNTSVNANSSEVSISNGTFNGSTTINAQSVSLGSIDQMTELLTTFNDFKRAFLILWDNLIVPVIQTSNTRTFVYGGVSYTYGLPSVNLSGTTYYMNIAGRLQYYLNSIIFHLTATYGEIASRDDPITKVITYNGLPVIIGRYTRFDYSYDPETDVISHTESFRYLSWNTQLQTRLPEFESYIFAKIAYEADTWYRWYSPRITPESNYFWYVYNTDTGQQEGINLAGLLYDISWYLGQMYVLQSGSDALDNMTDQVEAVSETFQEAEQREQQIMDSISSGIESFNPDLSEIGTFKALGWCSNYLQLIFLRLGTYGTVILVGLLLGVCMQFIGYFRYK